jgi:hypothetical protein
MSVYNLQENATLILHCESVFGIRVLVAQLLQARKECILQVFLYRFKISLRTWLKKFYPWFFLSLNFYKKRNENYITKWGRSNLHR